MNLPSPLPSQAPAAVSTQPDQHPAEIPPAKKKDDDKRGEPRPPKREGENTDGKNWPPDSIPNPMPGVDPQQTPGIDRLSAG